MSRVPRARNPKPVLVIESWGATDVGMMRRLNEDVFLVDENLGVYLVADGMGGHAAGEVASRLAADAIIRNLAEHVGADNETWPEHWNMARSAVANRVVDAIMAGHERVTKAVRRDSDLRGMGTTVVVAMHPPNSRTLVICHVGDSRAYRLRKTRFELLTDDHSWVHEQVAAGFLTEEAARAHPLKNVVTQALGGSGDPRVDILETELSEHDLFLLCSDGLNSMLSDEEIAEVLKAGDSLAETASALIAAANERGGHDNVTVVLLKPQAVAEG
jgi:protein phosphatase